jgi:hypothetical protein
MLTSEELKAIRERAKNYYDDGKYRSGHNYLAASLDIDALLSHIEEVEKERDDLKLMNLGHEAFHKSIHKSAFGKNEAKAPRGRDRGILFETDEE